MAWTWWEEQQRLARSDPNGQPEGRKWGWQDLDGLQAPEGSLPAHTGLETLPVRAQPSCQICSLLYCSPAPSDPRLGVGWRFAHPVRHHSGQSLRSPSLPVPLQLTWAQVSLYPKG